MSLVRHEYGAMPYYTSSLLDSFSVPHLFATRKGGVSTGVFSSLNLSQSRKDADGRTDTAENVAENYRRALLPLKSRPDRTAAMKQIHSDTVLAAQKSLADTVLENSFPESAGVIRK